MEVVLSDEEFESVLKMGLNMAIEILHKHAGDERYQKMNGTTAMLEIAYVLSTCNLRAIPDITRAEPQGTA